MNVLTRGVRGAIRSPIRAGAIIIMLAISISLIVAMLAAKAGVDTKITAVKTEAATGITVRPAGVMGFAGGGDPLTADQVATISRTTHVASTVSTLTDQLGTDDTSLTPSLELGTFGRRIQRFESSSGEGQTMISTPESSEDTSRPAPTPRTTVTGTTSPDSVAQNGGSLTISSGTTIDGKSSDNIALVGTELATKNNLKAGSTFTAYGQEFTVKGIFKTDNKFQDSGLIVPLATLQKLTDQAGAVTSLVVNADSSDNVAAVVSSLKSALGDKVDITSEQQRAENSVASLGSISNLATSGVVGATIAAAVIVLLTMTMIVRERKREIGVIKAIGGTNVKVITQFMTEALTLTVISGVIGVALGVAISGSLTQSLVDSQANTTSTTPRMAGSGGPVVAEGNGGGNFTRRFEAFVGTASRGLQAVTSSVTPSTIAAGVGLTLLIAILGSTVPAWLIARIRPAEVLRGGE